MCDQSVWHNKGLVETIIARDIMCGDCRRELIKITSDFQLDGCKVHIVYKYNDAMASLLYQYKSGDSKLAQTLFYRCLKKLRSKKHSIIIPPSSSRKTKERGYLPLELALSYYGIQILHPFSKDDDYEQKTSNQRKLLKEHIHLDCELDKEKKYILVDDVATSGTTLKTCMKLIRKQGIENCEIYLLSATENFIEMLEKSKEKTMFAKCMHKVL